MDRSARGERQSVTVRRPPPCAPSNSQPQSATSPASTRSSSRSSGGGLKQWSRFALSSSHHRWPMRGHR